MKLAYDAIREPIAPDLGPATINYQREQAKTDITRKWEERWHENQLTSLVYRTAYTTSPDGRLHPIPENKRRDGKSRAHAPKERRKHS